MAEHGPWLGRVTFGPGGVAYRPGELLVRNEDRDQAVDALGAFAEGYMIGEEELLDGSWFRVTDLDEPLQALGGLRAVGVESQVNHVLFTTGCCCPPHPASPGAEDFYAEMEANPFYASPFYASPFYASPFYASAGGGCGCCCGSGAGANPFYASPFYASPFYASAEPNPAAAPWLHSTGKRRSSARPAPAPIVAAGAGADGVRVAILDTGYAASHAPSGLPGIDVHPRGGEHPDEDGDNHLDPAAGHGTFIAGVIEQLTPGCRLEVIESLTTYGDGDEATIGNELWGLANRPDDERPHLVNLSFGGYTPLRMDLLASAIRALHRAGTVVVASAGNDATCLPMYPAAFPEVLSVGALDDQGAPAKFTNYGPWVKSCTLGVDVVSTFFEGFDGAEPAVNGVDADDFRGWATWSGTSFAAPRVVAALAAMITPRRSPQDAVRELLTAADRRTKPMLGTVVAM